MPRPRKPTALLELQGSFKKNPDRGRARKDEPEPVADLGEPPARLTPLELEMWRELESMAPPRVLTNADRWLVERACKLMAESLEERQHVTKKGEVIVEVGLSVGKEA